MPPPHTHTHIHTHSHTHRRAWAGPPSTHQRDMNASPSAVTTTSETPGSVSRACSTTSGSALAARAGVTAVPTVRVNVPDRVGEDGMRAVVREGTTPATALGTSFTFTGMMDGYADTRAHWI
jgi:hypothetical protein